MELVPIQREVFFRKCIRGTRFYFSILFFILLKRKYVYGDFAVWDGAVWDIPTLSWQFVTNLRFGELVGNSYEWHPYIFPYSSLTLCLGVDLLNFFLKIICFNQIVRIDTTPPLRKIVTFSHEVGLDIYEGWWWTWKFVEWWSWLKGSGNITPVIYV